MYSISLYMSYRLTSAIPTPHMRLVGAIVVVGRNYHELKEWPVARTLLSMITMSVYREYKRHVNGKDHKTLAFGLSFRWLDNEQ